MSKQQALELVGQALNGKIAFLPVRGHEAASSLSGDIDIVVPPQQAAAACKTVCATARMYGWYLGAFRDLGYVFSIILMKPDTNGNDYSIKLDFINGLSWLGVEGPGSKTDLFSGDWTQIRQVIGDEQMSGIVTFVQKMMASSRVSDKDWARIIATGVDAKRILDVCNAVGLPFTAAEIGSRRISSPKNWLIRFKSSGRSGLFGFISWILIVLRSYLEYKPGFNYNSGFSVSVSGMDGSGKSTVVDRLLISYRQAGWQSPVLVHMLPRWFLLPHQLFGRSKTKANYAKPYSERPVDSKASGFLRLSYYLVGFLLAKIWSQYQVRRGTLILQDRSFFDFRVDLARARIPLTTVPKPIERFLRPAGLLVYLDASAPDVVVRKGELTMEKANDLRVRYLKLCDAFDSRVIRADVGANEVYSSFLGELHSFLIVRLDFATRHVSRYRH